MQKLSILFFTICLLISFNAKAAVIDDLESQIAKDKNISFVTVMLHKTPRDLHADQKIDRITHIQYGSNSSRRFAAEIMISGVPYTVEGKFEEASLIPAFKSYVQKGHIVEFTDLITVKVANKRMAPHLFKNTDELLGKSAKRKLSPNQPIHAKDIVQPDVIKKGANIKMLFEKSGLKIEATGVALEGGAIGDFIKVKNIDSNKIIKAKVTDEATVSTNG